MLNELEKDVGLLKIVYPRLMIYMRLICILRIYWFEPD